MKKDEIENHLAYWRARQESEPTAATVFSVKMYCGGRVSGDLEPAKNTKKSKRKEAKTKKGKEAVRSPGPEVQATDAPSAEGQWLNTGLHFGMASAAREPGNGERSLMDVSMPGNEVMATAIPTCGLSLAPDMQESYGGDEHLTTDLELELEPELLDFLRQDRLKTTSELNIGLHSTEYTASHLAGTSIDGLTFPMTSNALPISNQAPTLMSQPFRHPHITGNDAYVPNTSHTDPANGPTAGVTSGPNERIDASQQGLSTVQDIASHTGVQDALQINAAGGTAPLGITGSKRKATDESVDQPVLKKRERVGTTKKAQTETASASGSTIPPTENEGTHSTGRPSRERKVSEKAAKNLADREAAQSAKKEKATKKLAGKKGVIKGAGRQ